MTNAQVAFLRNLIATTAAERQAGPIARRLADIEGVGRVDRTRVLYTPQDHERAANLLRSRGYPLEAPAAAGPRSSAQGAASEKLNAAPVAQQLVAAVLLNFPEPMPAMHPQGCFVAMPWGQALAVPYEVLLVCENLEPLLQLHEFTWLSEHVKGRPCVAIYRGGPRLFGTDAAARLLAHDDRPTLAFFDFDPKGLSMAASLPRREAVCLPPWPALREAVLAQKRTHLYTNSYQHSSAHLDAVDDAAIALAWGRLRSLATGLNQEGFPR